jgi:hypothetical protein
MEPESSLQSSHEPVTKFYFQVEKFNPYIHDHAVA